MPIGAMADDKWKEPKPKNLKEVPRYIKDVVTNFFSRLLYILKLVWETKHWILISMVIFAILDGVLPVASAYITASLLNSLADAYTASQTGATFAFSSIVLLLVIQFVYLFVRSIVGNIKNTVTRISSELVTNHIKLKIMNKSREVDLSSFDNPEFYAQLENANREAGTRPIAILSATLSVISTLISLVSFIVILMGVSPIAPLVIFIFALPGAIINFVYRSKYYKYVVGRSKERRKLNYFSSLMVNKDLAKEVRIFDLSDSLIVKYNDVFDEYYKGIRKLFVHEGLWNVFVSFCSTLVSGALFVYIAYGVSKGQFQIGDYSLYTGALNSITTCAAALITSTAVIYEGTLFIDNLITFLKEKKNITAINGNGIPVKNGTAHTIKFDNVSFSYPDSDKLVIKNMSFEIGPKETVVIVGLNGAGKTTLVKLLTRLYDVTEGTIYLDGRDIREYDVKDLYKTFGIIFQDFGKYAFTVKDNISFGDINKPIDMNEIINSAKKSNADNFIDQLPKKYDTYLMKYFEDDAIEPSIGQWQRLSIARAFYGDSDIMILDEPTASLDPIAEQEIFKQFDELSKDKTTIFVSHKLSSATIATKILVIENGELIETGTHTELMELKGKYHKLFTTQAEKYLKSNN